MRPFFFCLLAVLAAPAMAQDGFFSGPQQQQSEPPVDRITELEQSVIELAKLVQQLDEENAGLKVAIASMHQCECTCDCGKAKAAQDCDCVCGEGCQCDAGGSPCPCPQRGKAKAESPPFCKITMVSKDGCQACPPAKAYHEPRYTAAGWLWCESSDGPGRPGMSYPYYEVCIGDLCRTIQCRADQLDGVIRGLIANRNKTSVQDKRGRFLGGF